MIKLGKYNISQESSCFVIAKVGHNHQGNIDTAKKLIVEAANCGAQTIKVQKRDNKKLYIRATCNKPYDNENSFGATYGEHRKYYDVIEMSLLTQEYFNKREWGIENDY